MKFVFKYKDGFLERQMNRQMRDENEVTVGLDKSAVKRPYNLRDTSMKSAAYREMIRAELADELYDKIMNIIVLQKNIRIPIIRRRIWLRSCRRILAICRR